MYVPLFLPNSFVSRNRSSPSRSLMVLSPMDSSRRSVFFPIPGIALMSSGSRNAPTCSGLTTVSPSGFSKSDAIFAIILFGATPMEHVIFVSILTAFLICCASLAALPKSHSILLVTSRYASSRPMYSNTSANWLITPIASSEICE